MVQTCSAKQISYECHMNNPPFASFTKTKKKCSGVQREQKPFAFSLVSREVSVRPKKN